MKRQAVSVDAGGNCVVAVLQREQRVKAEVRPRVQLSAPRPPAEDSAPWVMRFLALALVLFVLVVLALHG